MTQARIYPLTHGKTSTVTQDTPYGFTRHTEHADGTVDATVRVTGLRLNLTADAPPNKQLVYAVAELEEANREHRLASASGQPEWIAYTKRRLTAANVRIQEVQ